MKRAAVGGIVLVAACELGGPHTPAVLDADRMLAHIQVLAADSLMGRVAASEDELRAARADRAR